ncbi:MAG TPA: FAD-binding oxidoreductase [Rhizomicrobium sp.]
MVDGIRRRAFLGAVAASATGPPACCLDISVADDISRLNATHVAKIFAPATAMDVQSAVKAWKGPVSVSGAGFSMGGQTLEAESLHLETGKLSGIVRLDVDRKLVRVKAGTRWRQLQEAIDPHGLAVKIMQSYANFAIGGAISVNAHGRYVGLGPIVNSIRRLQLVLADGTVVECDRQNHRQLFYGAIGGYGGLGIITEAELELVANEPVERVVTTVSLADYPGWFLRNILAGENAVLHNADIDPEDFSFVRTVSWVRTRKPVTLGERLSPTFNPVERRRVLALASVPGGHSLRRHIFDPLDAAQHPVVWRNHEASLDLSTLPMLRSQRHLFCLQEYFIPEHQFAKFARRLSEILGAANADVLNISVRHSPAETDTLLHWARQAVFSFVLFFRQAVSQQDQNQVGAWTRDLVDAALSCDGAYYLPYRLEATRRQFAQAYPHASRYFAFKQEIDPENRLRNKLLDKYRLV